MKKTIKEAQLESTQNSAEVDSLLDYFGIGSGGLPIQQQYKEPGTNSDPFQLNRNYQLPVQVGQKGFALSDGDKPWVVSRHAPGKQNATPTHPNGHNGIDLKAAKGTPVYAVGPGVVADVGTSPKGGNIVYTEHEGGRVRVYYAHLDTTSVQKGQRVSFNTQVGTVGDTGNAKGRGAHLHYEVKVDGQLVDPLTFKNKQVGFLNSRAARKEIFNEIIKAAKIQELKKLAMEINILSEDEIVEINKISDNYNDYISKLIK